MRRKKFSPEENFFFFKKGGTAAALRKTCDCPALRKCIESPDLCLEAGNVLKDSRTTKAALAVLDDGKKVFIKRYNNKGLLFTLKYIFRRSRAFRAWRNSMIMESCGLSSPRVIAACCRKKYAVPRVSYIISEYIENTVPALEFFRRLQRDEKLRESFISGMASLLTEMHGSGILHGDLKMSNVYVVEKTDGRISLGLWDLDALNYTASPLDEERVIPELARLISSYIELGSRLKMDINRADVTDAFLGAYNDKSAFELDRESLAGRVGMFLRRYGL